MISADGRPTFAELIPSRSDPFQLDWNRWPNVRIRGLLNVIRYSAGCKVWKLPSKYAIGHFISFPSQVSEKHPSPVSDVAVYRGSFAEYHFAFTQSECKRMTSAPPEYTLPLLVSTYVNKTRAVGPQTHKTRDTTTECRARSQNKPAASDTS
ncbi:hypothetical protein EVAR_5787_1 [Eumeta japonica]|uniref:Uncharacterized protein n=1 Tax=Eumeta variegata TaxID=151549 RepID=A0A4C1T4M4_EUMVA|nr:hypothetical protein EVAR_5787_1 [Eumeta japonica]